ncbi:MAG TPA: undecaprenyl-diphosphate phosphatase [Steroidobacteraceae bacterium]|nr:undecaprenyl-diphosphate phosphatase [Steroidobacteraceae bacterium]
MTVVHIVILAFIQGLAELLPVSSSAHVVVAEELMGLDPSSPPLTLLLVMLHTGTMFAVTVYFWRQWRATYLKDFESFKRITGPIVVATALTAIVGEALIQLIEKTVLRHVAHAQIEDLFGRLQWIAPALVVGGVLILITGLWDRRRGARSAPERDPDLRQSAIIGAVQGLCLPFRGFSRSGATISAGMLLDVSKVRSEAFSFALAVVLTPPVVVRELWRLVQAKHRNPSIDFSSVLWLSVLGMIVAFIAGLLALRWLSRWLERGRWHYFGIYCLGAAVVVGYLYLRGY